MLFDKNITKIILHCIVFFIIYERIMNPKLWDKSIEIVASANSHIDTLPEITDPDIKLEQMQDTVDIHTNSEAQKIEELAKTAEDTSHEKESFWSKYKWWFIWWWIVGAWALLWKWMSWSDTTKEESESNKIIDKNSTTETMKDNKELKKETIPLPSESKVSPEEDKSMIDSLEDTMNSAKENINQVQWIFAKVTSFFSSKK